MCGLPDHIISRLRDGALIPYLGTGISTHIEAKAPLSYEALAAFLGSKVALPRRARGNAWAAAQYIEGQRHRQTLDALMAEAFAVPVPPSGLHRFLATLNLPMIVDTWYDGAMRTALQDQTGWGEIQGINRAGIGESRWYRAYDPQGVAVPVEAAEGWRTLLYKPHGAVAPARNFLIADADYVEVLTEIDIQTPIPDAVKTRRTGRGFLFLGCRFHDQMLRSYARQIMKRSAGPHVAILPDATLTSNELKFLAEQGIEVMAG
ncbi:MAG: SIR2 family protein [Acetobacteraceae bacterium]|nr:SIR2 family protein [Acetobacteraceae bacterium]